MRPASRKRSKKNLQEVASFPAVLHTVEKFAPFRIFEATKTPDAHYCMAIEHDTKVATGRSGQITRFDVIISCDTANSEYRMSEITKLDLDPYAKSNGLAQVLDASYDGEWHDYDMNWRHGDRLVLYRKSP